jgi:succinate-semialdehyde dehydrogenase
MDNIQQVAQLIERARAAQAIVAEFSQEQIDAMVKAMGKIIFDNAAQLAKEAVEETGLGVYEHKIMKNEKVAAFWQVLKTEKTVGIIGEDPKTGLVKIAKPLGVLGCVSPTTNPTMTPIGNGMFAVKGGNALVVAPHPRAKKVSYNTVELMREAVVKAGGPADIVLCIEEPSIEGTQELMKSVDVIIATGGMGMVKAAYSSGKPAFGVGQGNVQLIIDRDWDNYQLAADLSVLSRSFDNGVICAGEQCIIMPQEKADAIKAAYVATGAYFVEDPADLVKLREGLFPGGGPINRDVVGQSVQTIAGICGLSVPEGTRVIIGKAEGFGRNEMLCREKLCPVMSYITYDKFEDAVNIAKTNLLYEGAGHTAVIWSNNKENAKIVGEALPVGRVVVNQPGIDAAGSLNNGLNLTPSLGCGSWGNNSISENLYIHHMINVTRVSFIDPSIVVPTPEEMWK